MSLSKSHIKNFLIVVLLCVIGFWAIHSQSAPGLDSRNPHEFSYERARQHIEAISHTPRPIGSIEIDRVRETIVGELESLGLSPQIQESTVVAPHTRFPAIAARVRNIVAREKGTDNSKAVLLVAHYDSVPTGLGAGDDGSGVAVLLEVARALKAGLPLRNDTIFVFTDGEEMGLLGARAFVQDHEWVHDAGVVLNFEARGVGGASLMFETSPGNERLISEFSEATSHQTASSLMYDIYRLLPQDTDFTAFKEAGIPGLNFAFIQGGVYYHTLQDSAGRIESEALRHQGIQAVDLTRHLGNLDLRVAAANDNAVYFNFGPLFLHYPDDLLLPITVGVTVVFVGAVIFLMKKTHISLAKSALGFVAFLVPLVGAPLLAMGIWMLISALHADYDRMLLGETYNSAYYAMAFTALAVAVTAGFLALLRKKIGMSNLAIGAMCWWVVGLLISSVYLKGGSYLFAWPLLFSIAGLIVAHRVKQEPLRSGLLLIAFVPPIILIAPLISLLFDAMTISLSAGPVLFAALLIGLLTPLLIPSDSSGGWLWPAIASVICILFLVLGSLTSGFDTNRPKPTSLSYGVNSDTGRALWASIYQVPDEWTSQVLSGGSARPLEDFFPLNARRFLQNEATPVPIPAPTVTLIEEKGSGIRSLRLRVTSSRKAPLICVYTEPDVRVHRATIDGKLIGTSNASGSAWGVWYYAPPDDGVELVVEAEASGPIKLRTVDLSYGLPDVAGLRITPRPGYMIPSIYPFSETTMVSKSFSF